MRIAEVQITLWDKPSVFLVGELEIKARDYVIVDKDLEGEIGKIIEIKEIDKKTFESLNQTEDLKPIGRKATLKDLEKLENDEKKKEKALLDCKKMIDKNQLPMKLVDVHFSFDDKKVIFAFIAEGRIDFRQLVKDKTIPIKPSGAMSPNGK